MIRQVIHDVAKVTAQDVATLLSHTEGTLQRRVDVTPGVSKCLQQLTFEFLFILCNTQPTFWNLFFLNIINALNVF